MAQAQKNEPSPEQSAADESWLVTYADLMSLLMCFFVILFSLSKFDDEQIEIVQGGLKKSFTDSKADVPTIPKEENSSQSVQMAFSSLVNMLDLASNTSEAAKRINEAEKDEAFKEKLKGYLEKKLAKSKYAKLKPGLNDDKLFEVVFPAEVFFAPGSSILKKRSETYLLPLVLELHKLKNLVAIDVISHVSHKASKTKKSAKSQGSQTLSNLAISSMQASAIADYLRQQKLNTNEIRAIGLGDQADGSKLAKGSNSKGKLANDRIHIIMSLKL